MRVRRGAIAAAGVIVVLGASAASAGRPAASMKPVIGKHAAVPAPAQSGKPFAVTFRITRSDTGRSLTFGRLTSAVSIGGRALRHSQSFTRGNARISLSVPANTTGQTLRVAVTIAAGGRSATKTPSFRIVRSARAPTVSIGGASVPEGNSGRTVLAFPVTLSSASADTVSVAYATTDGTAAAPGDFAAASGRIVFKPGTTKRTIDVSVVGDTTVEPDETLFVALSSATNAKIRTARRATGVIVNDEAVPRAGRYKGTTSQGRLADIGLAPGLHQLSKLAIYTDLACAETGTTLENQWIDLPTPFVEWPDWTFNAGGTDQSFESSWTITVTGQFAPPSAVHGTFRMDEVYKSLGGKQNVHCSSGDVTWSATLP